MDTNAMRAVGKSRLAVTPLGFGGGTIGSPAIGNEASLATVAAAWETGVRFYDTAPWYGLGRSERRLGLALAALDPKSEFRVNTKVGKTLVPEPARDEGNKTLSPGGEVARRERTDALIKPGCYTSQVAAVTNPYRSLSG